MHQTIKKPRTTQPSPIQRLATRAGSMLTALGITLLAASPAAAQSSYTAVDLTPSSFGVANAVSNGFIAGLASSTPGAYTGRAALWTPVDGLLDLHPALLDDPANGVTGRSALNGLSGSLQVGWGAGNATGNHIAAMAWRDSAASAALLNLPFASFSSQAVKTDGNQIVGFATPYTKDGTSLGPSRAIVWDAATGAAVDLGDGGNGAQALAVGRGMQAGYVMKNGPQAALWTGSSRSLIVVNPKNAQTSRIDGTDGLRQVGYAGYLVRIRVEAPKGTKDVLRSFANVWTGGNVNSATIIHPYPVNNPTATFTESFATAVAGPTIVGYATDEAAIGTPAYYHAIVWDASYQAIDLNAFLPSGFVGSQAFSVDAQGTIAGVMSTADGQRHAVQWVPNP
ncbi:MAG: hypothetical protein KGN80_07485 [Acidobacteriota bacterium]|nr:hypothetical protein [Acidobacteriota bacterium]